MLLSVDDIAERYDNLCKSVSDRNEKLQVTLTRSLSVQDGLDEMMSWMEKVEESVKETPQVPLDSHSITNALGKEAVCDLSPFIQRYLISCIFRCILSDSEHSNQGCDKVFFIYI